MLKGKPARPESDWPGTPRAVTSRMVNLTKFLRTTKIMLSNNDQYAQGNISFNIVYDKPGVTTTLLKSQGQ